jgi:glucokinase
LLKNGSFMQPFTRKGRMSRLVSRMPVHVILNPRLGLLGAARSGSERMRLNSRLSKAVGA